MGGLHTDNFDNFLFVINGSKRALVLPRSLHGVLGIRPRLVVHPAAPPTSIRGLRTHTCNGDPRRMASLPVERVAIDRNHAHVNFTNGEGQRLLRRAWSCEARVGEALFVPRMAPHAVVSTPEEPRGISVA